ncbi:MAG: STAS domain-containing protein [Acidaminococcaceae bacterium]|jgi:anti-anti-sigma factor|uniref:Anti-sigma factor antagonist n=1 Tax=Succiniclasticum ruminis TaxID=40841 RepID=A0A1G6NUH7_9FIRM|nr:STAS domain-containing protein [Succiniclasticum ruminis]MBQ1779561.1 STAS domain-containing protein [Acidaminococcaceae bacterium]MBQ2220885.1 STAS domain-containing protein [Acidaminococcaceae bacterium]MBQ6424612.1 STAS domain-containing protein [Acidaminococcaceae bacterium]MBQ6429101.1 STAS domain-containing protein [Acidaminococcaceae bacterium]MBQ6743589.1 STAS domain-containing protein [Acidaminococcaceae bacterium]
MEKEFLQTETAGANGWTVWSVNGRIDMVTAEKAYATGEDIVNRNEKTVLDMSGMDYLSSAGLRVLLRLNKLAKKSGKEFTLCGPSGIVKSVLEDSGMDALFTIYASLNELA